jgi:2-dehydro-3-deoxyphosphogluconate aldolase/(4S)-4-hydroxy-2-oxoglutarate aldolase
MNKLSESNLEEKIYKCGVIAVLVIDNANDAVPLANALLEGGINAMELTLRTPAAMDALNQIRDNVPEMIVGVGTVITQEQVNNIIDIGVMFGVAPGFNPNIVKAAQKGNLPFYPGIVTPSDIEAAVELGCRILKFFPAEPSGGLTYFKSMISPYSYLKLRYIPLGGLNEHNFKPYLLDESILAVGGTWIAKRDLIRNKDWKTIIGNAQMATKIVKNLRGE